MEKLRRYPRGAVAPKLDDEAVTTDVPAAPPSDTLQPHVAVHIVNGPLTLDAPLAGMTITAAYQLLQHTLNLAPGVTALVNGNEVEPRFRLESGQVLEFVRRAGVKGAAAR